MPHVAHVSGRRRFRRLTIASLSGMLLVGLLLPATAGMALANEPADAPRGEIVRTFEAAPTFGTAAVTPGTVGIKSSIGYEYGDGSSAIVGEILNLRTKRTINVLVSVIYLDGDNDELGSASEYVYLERTARGGVAPFVIENETGPPGTAAYLIEASAGSATSAAAGGALDISFGPTVVDDGFRYYEGTVSNPNPFDVSGASAMITVYGTADAGASPPRAAGDVIEVFAQNLGTIPAGDSVPYSFGIDTGMDDDTLGYTILADGRRASQTSVYVTAWANYFDDLPLTTFRRDIIWLAEQRITGGCAPGRYCPTANVTRAQMAMFLDRVLELDPATEDYFTDDEGTTGEASTTPLPESGITGGCGGTDFCPSASVKRDQMASFLARSLGLTGSAPNVFTDDTGNTHESNINRIAQAGITGGCGGTKYCPSANVTRGQMAAFLRRAFQE
jgi:S-layer homology domain